ncbi:MAG TPA: ABC transporter permease subunit [Patescibacteria group bacterium]|nr:ABC transporter permease subunit [Patescibacteria group bacterium]
MGRWSAPDFGGAPREGAPAARPAAPGPLVRLMVRGLLGRRRSLGVVILAAAPVLVALILSIAGGLGAPAALAFDVFSALLLGLAIPLVALILGTGALGTQIDDGTIIYVLVKPVPRRTVILAAMLVAALATATLAVPSTLLSGLLVLGTNYPGLQVGMALGAFVASVLYGTVFVTLSVFTGRALVVGLGYVLLWEGLVTTLLPGTRTFSIREIALACVSAVSGSNPAGSGTGIDPFLAAAIAGVALVVAVTLGVWRLARFEVSEAG